MRRFTSRGELQRILDEIGAPPWQLAAGILGTSALVLGALWYAREICVCILALASL